MASIAN